jgi:hypothetical protein
MTPTLVPCSALARPCLERRNADPALVCVIYRQTTNLFPQRQITPWFRHDKITVSYVM